MPPFKIASETDNCIYLEEGSLCVPVKKVKEGEKWIKHVHLDGCRLHVLSYYGKTDFRGKVKSYVRCSEPDCIVNKEQKGVW